MTVSEIRSKAKKKGIKVVLKTDGRIKFQYKSTKREGEHFNDFYFKRMLKNIYVLQKLLNQVGYVYDTHTTKAGEYPKCKITGYFIKEGDITKNGINRKI